MKCSIKVQSNHRNINISFIAQSDIYNRFHSMMMILYVGSSSNKSILANLQTIPQSMKIEHTSSNPSPNSMTPTTPNYTTAVKREDSTKPACNQDISAAHPDHCSILPLMILIITLMWYGLMSLMVDSSQLLPITLILPFLAASMKAMSMKLGNIASWWLKHIPREPMTIPHQMLWMGCRVWWSIKIIGPV